MPKECAPSAIEPEIITFFYLITASNIAARHPVDFHCNTDSAYSELASKISLLLPRIDTQNVIENIAVSIALYFEDLKSDTYQMEVFTKIYREWFGMYVPFYNSEDASSPSAELDALTFVVWHSICAERNGIITCIHCKLNYSTPAPKYPGGYM